MLQKLLKDKKVLAIFEHGSVVYGTFTEKSDRDYIVVVDNDYTDFINYYPISTNIGENFNAKSNGNDYNFYSLSLWQYKVDNLHIEAIESASLSSKHILKDTLWMKVQQIKYAQHVKLRKSISAKVNNSYDKARKKLVVEKDFSPYIAKKSLWHSIRILDYGIQCARYGCIVNYGSMNKHFYDIMRADSNEWDYFNAIYKPKLLAMRSEFRVLTNEAWVQYKEELDNGKN